ncbi:hypothetical protein [Roseofilum casamattae]|uniref:Uncharacterized protein n=1 Tax=Roseofilum casamattae BLCC-M143 TaxID=3022442 RepID=A0ABT7BWN1_9CYAN|nr:hypothetical protein [Roseofilum casamattae]MDJ1183485.1 hypothetical protein [Roseofilum casamattae BLCC-M143]
MTECSLFFLLCDRYSGDRQNANDFRLSLPTRCTDALTIADVCEVIHRLRLILRAIAQ